MWRLGTKTRNLPKACELEKQAQTPLDCFIPEFEAQPPAREPGSGSGMGAGVLAAAGRTAAAPTLCGARCSPSEQHKMLRSLCRFCKALLCCCEPGRERRGRAGAQSHDLCGVLVRHLFSPASEQTETPRNSPRPAEQARGSAAHEASPWQALTAGFFRHQLFFLPQL